MSLFFSGFGFLISGLKSLMGQPRLWRWAMIPVLITLVLLVVMVGYGSASISELVNWMLAHGPIQADSPNYGWLYYPVWILTWIAGLFMIVWSTSFIGLMVASPFLAMLSEEVLISKGLLPARPFSMNRWMKTLWMSVKNLVTKTAVFAVLSVCIFILSLLPGLNVLSLLGIVFFLLWDISDHTFDNLELTFKQRWAFVKQNKAVFLGMSAALLLTMFIPGLTLLLLPAAVVGSSQKIAQVQLKQIEQRKPV